MRILFSHSYFLHLDDKQLNTKSPYPPLATLYAAAYLREKGFEVRIADLQFSKQSTDIEQHIVKFKPDIFVIYDDGFNYLTKMCLTNMREAAFTMQQVAKKYKLPVIVSSSDATDHIENYFANGADYIIIGEAEQTLLELVKNIKTGKVTGRQDIDGLAYKENNKTVKTPPRSVLKNLDELPQPAWDLINIELYKKTWLKKHGYFSINFVTTRGCPYKCNWCAKPIYGNRYNSHSPQRTVALIKHLQVESGFTHIWFADDIFGLKPGWLKEFSELIESEKIKIKYKIQSRADLLLEDKNIEYLAKSGCDTVWIGAESGSQNILDAMDKGITVEQIKTACSLLRKHHIKPSLFLQFGYPGETKEDIDLTLKMINELLPEDIGVSVSYPLPGTKFYENVKKELKQKTNWTDSDEMVLMFKNNYSSAFYKNLHQFVHKNYRMHQGYDSLKTIIRYPAKINLRTIKKAASILYYLPSSLWASGKLNTAEIKVKE